MNKDILGEGILSGLEGWDISGFLSGDDVNVYEELPPLTDNPQIPSSSGYSDITEPVDEEYGEDMML